jgi:hypothetical protein
VSPQRIQLSRAKGFRLQEASLALNGLPAVKVDRSTRWGNTYVAGEDFETVDECIDHYRHDIDKAQCFRPDDYEAWIAPLRGRNIACWCALDAECHGDALLELAAE